MKQSKFFQILINFARAILIDLLRKGVYPYEYMDSWEKYDEKSLPDKKKPFTAN